MKFSNGKKLTIIALVFCGVALYMAIIGETAAAYAALVLASLETADD